MIRNKGLRTWLSGLQAGDEVDTLYGGKVSRRCPGVVVFASRAEAEVRFVPYAGTEPVSVWFDKTTGTGRIDGTGVTWLDSDYYVIRPRADVPEVHGQESM